MSDWMNRAACAGLPTDFFFSPDSARHEVEADLPGMCVCRHCEVCDECLRYAVRNRIEFGVYGGKTAEERKAMRGLRVRICPLVT